ncbi:m7GpppX diphosphatase-like [Limulus polyphemus]|uniref:m7GpppX diphosphatase n=1 Tax=Limulus polyphemus TaxID=6850 RepID=A0ABM1B4I5_LIMPO|nr:m7GpppX diphosphatase-like [Limulus polyphemus]XP_013774665.1 m7GpppX diphosphatase-like [Limulus polyphemus]XP_022241789.1 m7GpppX diphosphatase-like [Limulus polyphemus]XP_022241790.1 m7GpppX diphosphatase-like [Limulus polyphemus]
MEALRKQVSDVAGEGDEVVANENKKIKLSSEVEVKRTSVSVHENISSFENFHLTKILNQNSSTKSIFVEGRFGNDIRPAVILLEKTSFVDEAIKKMLCKDMTVKQQFHNDIYGSYEGFPSAEFNGVKTTIIHPATEKHIQKYSSHPAYLVQETPEVYKNVIEPHIQSQQFSMQWVYNILDHKSEADRIVFEDKDPILGFILLPDLKWDMKHIDNLYLVAICHRKDLHSLRDLTADHLQLLKSISEKGKQNIAKKFNIPEKQLRVYVHYQPSYYHFHVHFTALSFDAPGSHVERAHLLDMVIQNIQMVPDYYQKATLVYAMRENDPLYTKLQEANVL